MCCQVYNDARRNLIVSVMFAAQLELSEVVIFFNSVLLRGNRAIKVVATPVRPRYASSPPLHPLCTPRCTPPPG